MTTTPFVPIEPYADVNYANAYLGERLGTETWDVTTDPVKMKVLKMATQLIDMLPFIGYKTEEDFDANGLALQPRQFPRNTDTVIPPEISQATCEVALALLDGKTLEALFEKVGISSESTGGASASYTGDGPAELLGLNLGLPSPMAARLIAPWLRDHEVINLVRA